MSNIYGKEAVFNFPRNNFNNDIDKSVEGVLHFNYNKTT